MRDYQNHGAATCRDNVAVGNKYEAKYWTEEFKCTLRQLEAAIYEVGSSPDAVRHMLRRYQS
jgi:hypothetical protein